MLTKAELGAELRARREAVHIVNTGSRRGERSFNAARAGLEARGIHVVESYPVRAAQLPTRRRCRPSRALLCAPSSAKNASGSSRRPRFFDSDAATEDRKSPSQRPSANDGSANDGDSRPFRSYSLLKISLPKPWSPCRPA